MVVDSNQNVQIIVNLLDTRIEKTIGFYAKGRGFNRGDTAFAYRTRKAFAPVTRKALIKEREERLAKKRVISVDSYDSRIQRMTGFNAKGTGFNRGETAFAKQRYSSKVFPSR